MALPSPRPLFALLLSALCCAVLGFNVDVKNCIRHRGPEGSMFGFSVAQHKTSGRSWLLIGAPEAQTPQPGVVKGGAVFRCSTTKEDDCEEVPFDTRGNNNSTRSIQLDSKSRQWFGATVQSSGDNGVILACAPRYVYFTLSGNQKEPVGTCYVTSNFNDFSEYSPCRTKNSGYHRQGTCQAGLGASVSKDGSRLFIGAVGSWYWQGQLYSVNSSARLPFLPPTQYVFFNDMNEGQFYSQNLYSRPEVLSTNEGPPETDDSYLGYSVAVGSFGFGFESGAAVGMPRGEQLLGKVLLYSTNLTNLYNIVGEQIGAYFGYSICVSDVDGDGGDDIVVGAPMYSDYSKNDGSYETGKVYVYFRREGYRFNEKNTRMGFNSKSRFGLALTGLGDINRDGYGDFAVGAPYDGPDELGAVYVYHGSRTGVREKYSQLIRSEDVAAGGRPISTFGFSLSGGMDLDSNQYPDLIVGAYESDTAYFMKSRPVAQMTTSVNFMSVVNKQIALEHRNCTTGDGTRVPCLFLSTCLQYTGLGVDDQLNVEMQLVLDSKKSKSPRMFFLSEENRNVLNNSLTLEKNVQFCKRFNVYLKNNVRDKLTPLEAELRYRIIEENRRFTKTLTPVIDLDNELFAVSRDSISIQKNCGGDNICIPNLRLIAKPSTESFLLGSNEKLKIDVTVKNEGEDSFETTYDMTIPPGVNYVKIERIDNDNDIPVQCSAPSAMTNNTLHCDIGNPLPRNKYVQFKIVLEPYQTMETKARYEFNMAVNSTNPENVDSVSDNSDYLGIPLWVESDLIIEGSSKPVDVHYNVTMEDDLNITDEKQIGPQVIHIYGIRNKGPSDILEAEAYIDWPLFTLAGEPLLYLLELPETNGQVKCEAIEKINPLKLNIDRKRQSYFESSGLISSGSGSSSGSVVVKFDGAGSSSSGTVTRTKTFTELTDEEKKRVLEQQRKDEEESKSQWSDGTYEKKTRYQTTKTESTVIADGGGSGNDASSVDNANREPKFSVGLTGNGSVIRGEYSSESVVTTGDGRFLGNSGTSVTGGGGGSNVFRAPTFAVGSSESGSEYHHESRTTGSSSGTADNVAGSSRGGGGGSAQGTRWTAEGGVRADEHASYGGSSSAGAAYGAAHFGESSETVSASSSSFHQQSSGNQKTEYGGGASAVYGQSSANGFGGGASSTYGESSAANSGSDGRAWSRDGGVDRQSSTYGRGQQSSWETSRTAESNAGASSAAAAAGTGREDGKWTLEDRDRSRGGWNAGSSAGGGFASFRESENSHEYNSTWDGAGSPPKTYVRDRWRTNEDGRVRNGSSTRVVDGPAPLDYRGAVGRMNGADGVINVISTIPGDDSDLSVSQQRVATERTDSGSRRGKTQETETVERWRKVDGKLYKVNDANDWDQLLSRELGAGASTRVYEAHDYGPENYRKLPAGDPQRDVDANAKFKLYTRFRRDVNMMKKCGPTRCATVKCTIGPLSKDQEVWLSFRSRAWVNTLKKVAMNRPVTLSSTISAKVTKLPYIGKPDNKLALVKTHEVFTQVIPMDVAVKPDIIPLWQVVLAAVAGTAILLLLVYLLYKCGFFKRNRPSNAPEKQPLTHRNGQAELYQTGDEAL